MKKIDNSTVEPVGKQSIFDFIASEHGEEVIKGALHSKWAAFEETADIDIIANYHRVRSSIASEQRRTRKTHVRIMRWAAAILLPILAGTALWYTVGGDIFADKNRDIARIVSDPLLILPDGSQILMNSATENSRIAEQGDVAIKRENGKLIHEKQQNTEAAAHELQWGEVNVPKGSRFDMVLEDGTQVWLNADSKLRFPVEFSGDERRIHLEGEAYFAVAHDASKPFIVETPRQSVSVLGTEFNVYAYPEENMEYTTLVNGSVKVAAEHVSQTLTPGEQASLSAEGYMVRSVDVGDVVSWRDDIFNFEGNTLDEVFRKLARWYDIEYVFEDPALSSLTFRGNLSHTDDAVFIFEVIETIAQVDIRIKDNTVRISKK